ncbi:MAG TPA: hypothetical protein VM263_09785, partial [Acidimicrobiales bacterium]|nr:hypothetical protein [Acidimicrobiales bacterium]
AVLAAAAAALGADPLAAAGIVNPVLAGATALVAGVVAARRTGSPAWGAAAAGTVVVARPFLVYGSSALSEPLFTLLAVTGLVALAASIARRRTDLLAAATALVAAATLTRYAGAALVVAGAAALVRFEGAAGRRRALAFAAGAVAPLAAWLAVVGRTNRHLSFHPFDVDYWSTGADALSRWFAPAFVPWPARVAVAGAAGLGLWRVARRPAPTGAAPAGDPLPFARRPSPPHAAPAGDPLTFVLGAFAAAYLALLVAHRLLLDASGRLDSRFLLPLHVTAVVALAPLVHRAAAGRARRVVVGTAAALVALHAVQALSWAVTGVGDDGVGRRGLAARAWSESPVVAAVASLPPSVPVYSDGADALYLHTGRPTTMLPAHRDLLTGRARPAYGRELEAMARRLRRHGGVVVFFAPLAFRDLFLPTAGEVAGAVPLERVAADDVATMYRARP